MESEVNGILVAAHELKAPLGLVRQLALSFDFTTQPTDELEHIRAQMVDVSERAMRQVRDLTKIAQLETGQYVLEPVAVRAVCDEVRRELRSLFRFNQRELVVRYVNKSRLVTANWDLLYSVVYNFCLNAVSYAGETARSELTVCDHAGRVRVGVRDYGPMLPVDVWREMRRGWLEKPRSIPMRPGSSGLGLYIASRFSRYMQAEVGAVRHRDGTSFYVELPVSRQGSLF